MKKVGLWLVMAILALSLMSLVAGAKKQTLTTLNPSSWVSQETMRVLETAFEKEHPNVDLVFEAVPVSTYTETVVLRGAIGDLPDAFSAATDDRLTAFVDGGLVASLDELVEITGLELNRYPPILFKATSRDGKLYGLPMPPLLRGTINYNKDAFREAGIPFLTRQTSWNEFKEILGKLIVKDGDKISRYGALSKYPMLDLTYAAGYRVVDDQLEPEKVLFGQDAYVNLIREFMQMTRDGLMMPHTVYKALGGSKPQIFGEGKVAMVLVDCNWKGQFETLPFEWDIELIPSPSGKFSGAHASFFCWTVNSKAKDKESAFEWVRWVILSESALRAEQSLLKFNRNYIPYAPELREVFAEIATTKKPNNWECLFEAQKYVLLPWVFEGSADFGKIFWETIWDVLYERAPVDVIYEAAKEAQKIVDKLN